MRDLMWILPRYKLFDESTRVSFENWVNSFGQEEPPEEITNTPTKCNEFKSFIAFDQWAKINENFEKQCKLIFENRTPNVYKVKIERPIELQFSGLKNALIEIYENISIMEEN
jgi:hypothetical protein